MFISEKRQKFDNGIDPLDPEEQGNGGNGGFNPFRGGGGGFTFHFGGGGPQGFQDDFFHDEF